MVFFKGTLDRLKTLLLSKNHAGKSFHNCIIKETIFILNCFIQNNYTILNKIMKYTVNTLNYIIK